MSCNQKLRGSWLTELADRENNRKADRYARLREHTQWCDDGGPCPEQYDSQHDIDAVDGSAGPMPNHTADNDISSLPHGPILLRDINRWHATADDRLRAEELYRISTADRLAAYKAGILHWEEMTKAEQHTLSNPGLLDSTDRWELDNEFSEAHPIDTPTKSDIDSDEPFTFADIVRTDAEIDRLHEGD